jgi:scyllo-inositol 2-dehydrogenase (NADP+)
VTAAAARPPLRVGLIGYGLAGSAFHAPLIEAVPGLRLASVVTANPDRAARASSTHPDAAVLPSADALLGSPDEYDLVVVASPNRFHAPLGMAALEARQHLVVDKPLAANTADARRLASAAREAGVVAAVFHNRRWDGDFLTLRRLIDERKLGEVQRFESRFDRWRPEVSGGSWREGAAPEDAGGTLFDLGPHLIDQVLFLLGPAVRVYAEVRRLRPGAAVDDDFFIALEHESGTRSHLWGSQAAAQPGPRFRVLGSRAAYVKWGLDVQESQLRAGERPDAAGFGREPRERWGLLGTEDETERVETEAGRYVAFYEEMERAIRDGGPPPAPLEAGIATLTVIEAAFESARIGATVELAFS